MRGIPNQPLKHLIEYQYTSKLFFAEAPRGDIFLKKRNIFAIPQGGLKETDRSGMIILEEKLGKGKIP